MRLALEAKDGPGGTGRPGSRDFRKIRRVPDNLGLAGYESFSVPRNGYSIDGTKKATALEELVIASKRTLFA